MTQFDSKAYFGLENCLGQLYNSSFTCLVYLLLCVLIVYVEVSSKQTV